MAQIFEKFLDFSNLLNSKFNDPFSITSWKVRIRKLGWTSPWLSLTYMMFSLLFRNNFSPIFAGSDFVPTSLGAQTSHPSCRLFCAHSAHANALVLEKTLYGFQITVYGYWSIYGIFSLLYGINNNYVSTYKIKLQFKNNINLFEFLTL